MSWCKSLFFFGSSSLKHFVLYNMDKTTMIAGFPMLGLNTLQIEPLEGVGQTSGGLKKKYMECAGQHEPYTWSKSNRSIDIFITSLLPRLGLWWNRELSWLPRDTWWIASRETLEPGSVTCGSHSLDEPDQSCRQSSSTHKKINNISSFHQLMIVQFLVWSEL